MELHNDAIPDYQPLMLLRNFNYPTYQLWAVAGRNSSDYESVLKICILETVKWLRQRFRAFELPKELDLPEPSQYKETNISQFCSFHLNMGYKLEVIWVPSERIWTLQLTEPDLGPKPGESNQERPPVPGRLFETNVSYRLTTSGVECGFRTIVSDPVGTEAPCEVFRLAFIKNLVRNPLVGLSQFWPLIEAPHWLATSSDIKQFMKWITDENRTIPAVVFSEYTIENQKSSVILTQSTPTPIFDTKKLYSGILPSARSFVLTAQRSESEEKPYCPIDISDLAHFRMGYAQFFILKAEVKETFIRDSGIAIPNGGAIICEPQQLGRKVSIYTYQKVIHEGFLSDLDNFVQNYPKKKALDFSRCVFAPQAKKIEKEIVLKNSQSKEELIEYYSGEIDVLQEKHHRDLADNCIYYDKELKKYSRKLEALEHENMQLKCQFTQRIEELDKKRNNVEQDIERMRMLRARPQKPSDVGTWINTWFADRMVFHDKAQKMMKGLLPNEVDLSLLCDALEYLAIEYWNELNGKISKNERDTLCSRNYNRPFIVVPLTGVSVEKYPSEYKIKYNEGYKEKPVETPLDLHLKVGNEPENLLRIYFLYDKTKHLIVIGSLPKHLRTVSCS